MTKSGRQNSSALSPAEKHFKFKIQVVINGNAINEDFLSKKSEINLKQKNKKMEKEITSKI